MYSLTHLNLSCNWFSDNGIQFGLTNNSSLKYFAFESCGISSVGAATLVSLLLHQPVLNKLDLSQSSFGSQGVICIVEAMKTVISSLKYLNLNFCNISNEGAHSLAVLLSGQFDNSTIKLLDNPFNYMELFLF